MDFQLTSLLFKDAALFDIRRESKTLDDEVMERDQKALQQRLKDCAFRQRQSAQVSLGGADVDVSSEPSIIRDLKRTLESKQLLAMDKWAFYGSEGSRKARTAAEREKRVIYIIECCRKLLVHMERLLECLRNVCAKHRHLYTCFQTLEVKAHHEIHGDLHTLVQSTIRQHEQSKANAVRVREKDLAQLLGNNQEHLQRVCAFMEQFIAYQLAVLTTLDYFQDNMSTIDRKYRKRKSALAIGGLTRPDHIKLTSEHLKRCEEICEEPDQIAACFMTLREIHGQSQDLLDALTRSQHVMVDKIKETFLMDEVMDNVKIWRTSLAPVLVILARTRHYVRSRFRAAKKSLLSYEGDISSLMADVEYWKKRQQQQITNLRPLGRGQHRGGTISEKEVSNGLYIQDQLERLLPEYNQVMTKTEELARDKLQHEELTTTAFHKAPYPQQIEEFQQSEKALFKRLKTLQAYQESILTSLSTAHEQALAKLQLKFHSQFVASFLVDDAQRAEMDRKIWNTFEKLWDKIAPDMAQLERHVTRHYDQSLLDATISADIDDLASSVKGVTELFRQFADSVRHSEVLACSRQLLEFAQSIVQTGRVDLYERSQ